ncbi:hypothetical protein [Kineosporia mesophila]|uniref:hypothetical protein n=1 Tax=Kineosporia mesophila TaxID=566012 RepID=UPI001E418801|nr:hypothetical protein [Kineosporia mesophila]MCD5354063.1 hypothetical protein [Kineosporia mesophila]
MLALNGIEATYLLLVLVGIAVSLMAMWQGEDRRLGRAAIIAAVVIPWAGSLLALAYGVNSLVRRRPREMRDGSGPSGHHRQRTGE